jgi:UDP-N-acetylmuramoyl-tripeptide--D-alanyl-D-alanine ligase
MQQFFKHIVVSLLTWEARMVIHRNRPFIIAVTGSVGKTTTKDAIAAVLSGTGKTTVRKSEKSFNSEIGLPLTILGLSNAWRNPFLWLMRIMQGLFIVLSPGRYPEVLVLEIGADHPGDIARVGKWLKPNVAVVTRLPDRPVHVEFFSSPEEVKKEKSELVKALRPDGVYIANADDPAVLALSSLTTATPTMHDTSDDQCDKVDATGTDGIYSIKILPPSRFGATGSYTIEIRWERLGATAVENAENSLILYYKPGKI